MPTIAITGATGQLGRLVLHSLKTRAPGATVIALARSPAKAADLGVSVRQADYTQDPATLASALAVGSHTFQAKYSGDGANYIASNSAIQSVTVLQADTTSAVSAISPAAGIVASGSPLTLQVTVSTPAYVAANAARPTGTVTFVSGAATLGTATVSNGVASLTINPTALGNFNICATSCLPPPNDNCSGAQALGTPAAGVWRRVTLQNWQLRVGLELFLDSLDWSC